MKRNGLFVLVLALAAVLCTGCGVKDEDLKSDPLVNADGTAPVGKTLVAPAPPEGFTLLDNKDILAANGLYYASWVSGDPQPYENSEGKTVDLYDAQLTLVVQENKPAVTAALERLNEAGEIASAFENPASRSERISPAVLLIRRFTGGEEEHCRRKHQRP